MSNSFQDSVEYLLSLGNEVLTMKLGLENIRTLLDALDRPQDRYVKVQVAGTNGKGSVCAFLNSICVTAGVRTGMFTSPHLVSITERVQINGEEISEGDFARFATRVRETSERLVVSGELENIPTFFEQVTAIALLAFAEKEVEVAILETGLGGRLDATTAADAEIAAITRIDFDHQQYLGETIEEIAAEKAAIIRENTLAVIEGDQLPVVRNIILQRCEQMGMGAMVSAKIQAKDLGDRVDIYPFGEVKLGLLGRHQIDNAKVAILVLEELIRRGLLPSITADHPVEVEHVVQGLESAGHPGRLERMGRFLLDGAHNPSGARALKEYLDEFVRGPVTIIFGSMNDKDAREILSILYPSAELLILTRAESPRSRMPDELLDDLPALYDGSKVLIAADVGKALKLAEDHTPPDATILITGSLYLIGEVKRILESNFLETEN